MNASRLFIFAAALVFTLEASAQFYTGPTASDVGGAGRAAIDGNESVFLNPASLAYLDRYYLALPFQEGSHPNEGYEQTYGLIISDGMPDKMIPGSLSYLRRRVAFQGAEANMQNANLAVGGKLSDYVGLGLAAHYRTFEQAEQSDYFQTNFDLGAIVTPLENLGIGLVAYNVLSAKDNVPIGIQDVPTLALGVNYMYGESFSSRLDLVRPDKFNPGRRADVHLGVQTIFMEAYVLRLGSNWKETENQTWITGGAGYRGPRLSLNYAYQQELRESEGVRHIIDLWMTL